MIDLNAPVLVADDMMAMRKLIVNICKEIGFKNLAEAEDGAIGWKILEEKKQFGLIICDWNMPNLNGIDLLKKVRSDARFKSIPFIMVTAELENHQKTEAQQAGVTGLVSKPFTSDIFKQKLKALHLIA